MRVRDALTGAEFSVRARVTVNAAGARAGEIMAMFGAPRPFPLLKAMNLVTSKPASDMALAAPRRRRPMLTLVPWHGRALVGTGQSTTLVEPGDTGVHRKRTIDAFIADANDAFPALQLTRADITLVHRGIVPATPDTRRRAGSEGGAEILDHATRARPARSR